MAFVDEGREHGGRHGLDQAARRIPANGPDLHTRQLIRFQGDPVGPSQTLSTDGGNRLNPPDAAMSATITTEGVSIRLQMDGTAADATHGLLLPAGSILTLTGRASLQSASFFSTAAGGTINVAYFD